MTQVRISNSRLSKMTSGADQTTFNQREKKEAFMVISYISFPQWYGQDLVFFSLCRSKGLHYTLENNNCFKVCQIMIFTTQAASTISHFLIIKILLSHQTLFSIFEKKIFGKKRLIYFVKSTFKECLSQSVLLSVRSIRQMVALYFVI